MTRYNTGNPLGSTDPRDLYDNAENLDAGINGTGPQWIDRLGLTRKSWAGLESDFQQFLLNGSAIEFATYAAASAAASAGQIPENRQVTVVGDTGTHTDPVSGTVVPNSGRYVFTGGVLAWRSADVLSQKANQSEVDLLSARTEGGTEQWRFPNQFYDSFYARLAAGANVSTPEGFFSGTAGATTQITDPQGRPAVRITGASAQAYWRVPISFLNVAVGEAVSIAARFFDKAGTVNNGRMLVRGLTSSMVEVNRVQVTVPAIDSGSAFVAQVPGFVVASTVAYIEVSLQSSSGTGPAISVTDILVAKGLCADYRAPIGELGIASEQDVTNVQDSIILALTYPNVVNNDWAVTTQQGQGAALRVPEDRNGYKAVKVSATSGLEWSISYPRSLFGATFSVSGLLVDATNTVRRILVRQFNAAGSEIAGTRVTLQPANNSNLPIRVEQSSVAISPDCATIALYISGGVSGTATAAWWAEVFLGNGESTAYRPYINAAATSAVSQGVSYVSTSGDDNNPGTLTSPKATLNSAIDSVSGNGVVFVLPGTYGSEQLVDPTKVKGLVSILGARNSLDSGNYSYPIIKAAASLTGATLVAGTTKVYQLAVAGLPALSAWNFCYQDGVADPRTLIADDDREPQHRGRTNRIPFFAKLMKTSATTLSAALAEMDASSLPMSFIDSGNLYFTVVDGTDAATASIRVDAPAGLFSSTTRGSCGIVRITGLNVLYGGIDLRPFKSADLDEVVAAGSREDAVAYNVLSYGTLETCAGGSQGSSNGDGLNGHRGSKLTSGNDLYSHDNNDDGFSDHEGSSSRLKGGLIEYNGGGAISIAHGSDHESSNFTSRRNQQRTNKPAAFNAIGVPGNGSPPETGVDTRAKFTDCVDIESRTSFGDESTRLGLVNNVRVHAINCKSIRPSVRGFEVWKATDCSYIASGTSNARNAATIVETTTPLE